MLPARRRLLVLLQAGLLAAPPGAVYAATVVIGGGGEVVEGSGRMVEEARPLAPFTRVLANGAIDIRLHRSGVERAVVHADDNIAPLIEVRVANGKLTVQTTEGASFRTGNRLLVEVGFKQIDSLQLRGSGNIDADAVTAGIFEAWLQGSGNVRIRRLEADTVAISVVGSGDFGAGGHADKAGFVI